MTGFPGICWNRSIGGFQDELSFNVIYIGAYTVGTISLQPAKVIV